MFARFEQLKNGFNNLSHAQKRNLIILVILLISLPLTVLVAQIQQELRQRASSPPISTPLPPPGIFAKALKVNPSTDISWVYVPPLITSDRFTVEAWVKKDTFTGSTAEAHQVFFQGSYGSGIEVSMWIGGQVQLDNGRSAWIQTTFWDSGGPQTLNSTSPLFTTDEWHHVALVRDGSTARIYLDGSVVGSKSSSGFVPFTNSQGMSIGSRISSPPNDPYTAQSNKFKGLIDEVRVSNIARYTFNFGVPTYPFSPDSSTLALYHFDNDTQDASGNNKHNQISRSVEFVDSDLFTPPTPTPIPPTPTSASWWPIGAPEEPTPTPYVAPVSPTPTTAALVPVPQGQCPSGSSPQCLGYTTASGKTANCYTPSGQFTADICWPTCGSCGYITPAPSTAVSPTTPPTTSGSCPQGTVRQECIGYAANNINAYCWGANNAYLGGVCSTGCAQSSACGATAANPTPTTPPSTGSGACADECYSDDLRTNVGKSNGVCNSSVISTSHICPSAQYNGQTFSCGGRTYTCNGYWQ